jgi:hypothetical protein
MVVDGAINGRVLMACGFGELAPTLRTGDIVVLDSQPLDKVVGAREAIEGPSAVGFRLCTLPPSRDWLAEK